MLFLKIVFNKIVNLNVMFVLKSFKYCYIPIYKITIKDK